jgi:hypothetical protein
MATALPQKCPSCAGEGFSRVDAGARSARGGLVERRRGLPLGSGWHRRGSMRAPGALGVASSRVDAGARSARGGLVERRRGRPLGSGKGRRRSPQRPARPGAGSSSVDEGSPCAGEASLTLTGAPGWASEEYADGEISLRAPRTSVDTGRRAVLRASVSGGRPLQRAPSALEAVPRVGRSPGLGCEEQRWSLHGVTFAS